LRQLARNFDKPLIWPYLAGAKARAGEGYTVVRTWVARVVAVLAVIAPLTLGACAWFDSTAELPPADLLEKAAAQQSEYRIGPLDNLQIFVWRNPDLSISVPVRPDGRISVPLIEDLEVTGKTPTQLARDIEKALGVFVQDPIVTVIVSGFVGPFQDQIRVVGEAARPQALPYRDAMTLLDLMIQVGGLTDFAAGNRATITRVVDGQQKQFRVRLDDLLRDGDISANVKVLPGDVLMIPEAWF
jgi:polysaccharide export outer membrane protein